MDKPSFEAVAALYTKQQADGAWPNGARVYKVNSQPDDATPDGTGGTILGSVDVRDMKKAATFAYFVIWDDKPGLPIGVADTNNDGSPRLERAQ